MELKLQYELGKTEFLSLQVAKWLLLAKYSCVDDKWNSSDSLNADSWKRFHVSRQGYCSLLPEKKVMEVCFTLQFLETVIVFN